MAVLDGTFRWLETHLSGADSTAARLREDFAAGVAEARAILGREGLVSSTTAPQQDVVAEIEEPKAPLRKYAVGREKGKEQVTAILIIIIIIIITAGLLAKQL